MQVPKKTNGYSITIIQAIENSMIQVIYQKGNHQLYVRKAIGEYDISGDDKKYDEVEKITVKGRKVKIKGNDGKVNTAIWSNKGYSFSIYSHATTSRAKIKKLIQKVG